MVCYQLTATAWRNEKFSCFHRSVLAKLWVLLQLCFMSNIFLIGGLPALIPPGHPGASTRESSLKNSIQRIFYRKTPTYLMVWGTLMGSFMLFHFKILFPIVIIVNCYYSSDFLLHTHLLAIPKFAET